MNSHIGTVTRINPGKVVASKLMHSDYNRQRMWVGKEEEEE